MGYLLDFIAKLEGMLAELPKVEREKVVTFVKTSVLESYRNGVKKGKTDAGV